MYLIQRGTTKTKNKEQINGLDSFILFDYMGAAEFEFGALPTALKEIISCNDLVMVNTKITSWDGFALCALCREVDVEKVKENLNTLATKPKTVRTHEGVYIKERLTKPNLDEDKWYQKFDFWWCIDKKENWMAILGKNTSELLIHAVNKVRERKNIPVTEIKQI